MQASTVEEHLQRMDAEMQVEGLTLDQDIEGTFEDGEPFRIRSYKGMDDLGNNRQALRVATRFGVIMAFGPLSSHDVMRGIQLAFVPNLGERTWPSGSDLNGDGLPNVVLMRSHGELQIWGLHAKGASPYPIASIVPVTGALDIDGDGRPELMGQVPIPAGDVLTPRLIEVVSFLGGEYRTDTPSVRSFHARMQKRTGKESATSLVEWLFHKLRAGGDREKAFEAFDEAVERLEGLFPSEKESLRWWRGWLSARVAG